MQFSIEQLSWVDGVIFIFIFWGIFWGIKRGLTGEILKIVGVLAAFILAIKYCSVWGAYINSEEWADQKIVDWLAFFLIFFIVALVFFVLAKIPYLILRKTFLGGVDRLLGGVFGALRGLVIISVILTCAVVIIGEKASQIIEEKSFAGRKLVTMTSRAWEKIYEHNEEVIEKVKDDDYSWDLLETADEDSGESEF